EHQQRAAEQPAASPGPTAGPTAEHPVPAAEHSSPDSWPSEQSGQSGQSGQSPPETSAPTSAPAHDHTAPPPQPAAEAPAPQTQRQPSAHGSTNMMQRAWPDIVDAMKSRSRMLWMLV